MKDEFPNVNNYLDTFSESDWSDQIIAASDEAISQLKSDGVIRSKQQLLNTNEWRRAVAYKVLSKIYPNIGGDEMMRRAEDAEKKYMTLIRQKRKSIDLNMDGRLSRSEINQIKQARFWR